MTIAELCIFLLSHYPSDAKVFIYGGDEEYHSDDYNLEGEVWSIEENEETYVYL